MKTLKVTLNATGTVTLRIKERWGSYGPIRNQWQVTFTRREFERALRDAEITIPWQDAAS